MGRTVQVVNPTRSRTYRVVGVVPDHKRHGVLESPTPFVYFADRQRPSRYQFIVARTTGDAEALLLTMRRELLAIEPGLVFMGSATMEQNLGMSLLPARVGRRAERESEGERQRERLRETKTRGRGRLLIHPGCVH